MHPESSAVDDKQLSPLLAFYLSALAFVGAFILNGVFQLPLARNAAHRNDRHRYFCPMGRASFP